ncbi:MAG: rhomboid family intramembrane serine protease [Gemmatimonadetes bacterium]|nr:rhomboid family intramembrane serine protease [Gemmatimonadota bacterium]
MTPWVLRIVIATGAVYLIQISIPNLLETLFALYGPNAWFRPWSFASYMFLHAPGNFGHIFWNMLGLFFFGPILESRLGGRHFLQLYLISGIVGGLCWLIFSAMPMGGVGVLVGASGGVFGVQLGFAYFWPRQPIHIWGIIPIEARWLVLIMTVVSLWMGVRGGGNVAHFAHLGGFLGGFLFLRWLEARQQAPLREWQRKARPSVPRMETASKAMERWSRIRREELHEVNRAELDRILDKIGATGVASLTASEREFLERFSARLQ